MSRHYLLQRAQQIPDERRAQAETPDRTYMTKTFAAPGDDDDEDRDTTLYEPWVSQAFMTKTDRAPGDDDDYQETGDAWSEWAKSSS